jgi:hypothetical protein
MAAFRKQYWGGEEARVTFLQYIKRTVGYCKVYILTTLITINK